MLKTCEVEVFFTLTWIHFLENSNREQQHISMMKIIPGKVEFEFTFTLLLHYDKIDSFLLRCTLVNSPIKIITKLLQYAMERKLALYSGQSFLQKSAKLFYLDTKLISV